jgi:casein kinase 1
VAEEFNKYLSYVRNLGFEDTPDYDYLRELFTQALKNTGDVEDGEYDWMKLNNGKGWEAMKHHPSQHLNAPNAVPNSSARALGGGADTPRGPATPAGVSALRLNAAQPLPPSPAKPGVGKTRDRPGVSGAALPKRQSGAAGGLNDVVTPTASTQAQFQNSTANLPHRMSQANPGINQSSTVQQGSRHPNAEQQPSAMQKFLKAICCSR